MQQRSTQAYTNKAHSVANVVQIPDIHSFPIDVFVEVLQEEKESLS